MDRRKTPDPGPGPEPGPSPDPGPDPRPDPTRTIDLMLRRASVRRFTPQPVDDPTLERIVRAGQQAPFTGQTYSVVAVREPERRHRLGKWLGPLAERARVCCIICVDIRRLERFVALKGRRNRLDDLALLVLGIQDAAYMAQNMVLAAEDLGLGSVFLGGVAWLQRELAAMLDLPPRVLPLVGLCLGRPAEAPPARPRIPTDLVLHHERYRDPDDAELQAALGIMDAGLLREGYYRKLQARIPLEQPASTQRGDDGPGGDPVDYDRYGWGEHISRKYGQSRLARRWGNMASMLVDRGVHLPPAEGIAFPMRPIGVVENLEPLPERRRGPARAPAGTDRDDSADAAGEPGTAGAVARSDETEENRGRRRTARARVVLAPDLNEGLCDIRGFEYVWLVFAFNRLEDTGYDLRLRPGPDPGGPPRGLFATRSPRRPNPIGLSLVRLTGCNDRFLYFDNYDIWHGTPVLDIKPYVPRREAHPEARAGWLDND